MKENYLFRDRPNSRYRVLPQYNPDGQLLHPGILEPIPPADGRPIHAASLTLGILALVLVPFIPLVTFILGLAGRISGENHDLSHNILAGKICCNVAFWLAGLQFLLWLAEMLLMALA